ncbi:MAG TPA: glycosyltransferase family 2 protein [Solirubrobacteraceae bacterium]|nr:glycosyltransferase family 2 protein [Solirubrobacteraceae bacterium]
MTEATVVIPTRARLAYLEVALRSIAASAKAREVEVLVVDDAGETPRARQLAALYGARYIAHPRPLGLNAARNTGVQQSDGELVAFVDDDVEVAPGWLGALLGAAAANTGVDVFTGPVRARLEGPTPRSCGREAPPITTLDLGASDTDTEFAWGANMAIRRSALERVGVFDPEIAAGGDEQEWQERMRAQTPGARVRYVAAAALAHRRAGDDARLRALCRTALVRGAAARRFDARRGRAPGVAYEAATLLRCLGHVLRYRCPAGLTMAAHSWGRLTTAASERLRRVSDASDVGEPAPGRDDFLSGASGTVGGLDGVRRGATDRALDAWDLARGARRRLALAAASEPPRRDVLALGVVRDEHAALASAARAELQRTRHGLQLDTCAPEGRGRFENLNLLLRSHVPDAFDWLLIIDDDVELPRGFLDRFLFVCERFGFALAQPAHRLDSHAAWSVTRRRAGSVARETGFVEIGPVTAFARETFGALLPFPELRMGWGLDVHWAALAREHGWRCGVVDAVAIRHRAAPAAASYPREAAVAEARAFLAEHPYVSAREADRTLATHRRL